MPLLCSNGVAEGGNGGGAEGVRRNQQPEQGGGGGLEASSILYLTIYKYYIGTLVFNSYRDCLREVNAKWRGRGLWLSEKVIL